MRRATVEWSVGLLGAHERSLLEVMTVFVDGWTVEQILADRVVFGRADARIEIKAKDSSLRPVPSRRGAASVTPVSPVPVPDPANFGVQLGAGQGGG